MGLSLAVGLGAVGEEVAEAGLQPRFHVEESLENTPVRLLRVPFDSHLRRRLMPIRALRRTYLDLVLLLSILRLPPGLPHRENHPYPVLVRGHSCDVHLAEAKGTPGVEAASVA